MIVRVHLPDRLLTDAVAVYPSGISALAAWQGCQSPAGVWLTPGAILIAVQGVGWLLPINRELFDRYIQIADGAKTATVARHTDYAGLRITCRFAGIRTLYLPMEKRLRWLPMLIGSNHWREYIVMSWRATAADGQRPDCYAVREQTDYLSAVRLISEALPAEQREQGWQNLYSRLCRMRNRAVGQVLGIGEQENPVGCLVMAGPFATESGPLTYLSDLFVLPAARHSGRGKALMQAAIQVIATRQTEPGTEETALLLCRRALTGYYQKMGFIRTGSWLRTELKQ